jgi:hypothetical protein
MASESNPNQDDISPQSTFAHIPEIRDPSRWHKTSRLPDGTVTGRLGAYWYILDENGWAVSTGYHEISCDEHGDYIGARSNHTEPIVLSADHKQAESNPYDVRTGL